MTQQHLAVTMGDPAGIGPEIIVKACEGLRERIASGDLKLLIIGSGAAGHFLVDSEWIKVIFQVAAQLTAMLIRAFTGLHPATGKDTLAKA